MVLSELHELLIYVQLY